MNDAQIAINNDSIKELKALNGFATQYGDAMGIKLKQVGGGLLEHAIDNLLERMCILEQAVEDIILNMSVQLAEKSVEIAALKETVAVDAPKPKKASKKNG